MSGTETTQLTKPCRMCGVMFVIGGSKINCDACGKKSGDAHKAANQLKKALKLAAVLAKHGVSSFTAAQLDQNMWNLAAELAQVTEPSEETQAMTITLLRGDTK